MNGQSLIPQTSGPLMAEACRQKNKKRSIGKRFRLSGLCRQDLQPAFLRQQTGPGVKNTQTMKKSKSLASDQFQSFFANRIGLPAGVIIFKITGSEISEVL